MKQYTCEAHPGQPAHHSDDCDARGVSWTTIPLQTSLERLQNSLFGNPPETDVPLINDAILAHRLHAALKAIEEDHSDFLAYMTGELAGFPCCCEDEGHAATPPMMWPELVACIVRRAKRDMESGVKAKT